MLKTYRASCHCGRVVVEPELDLEQSSFRCNCSICRRNRFWPAIAKPEGFRQITGESEMTQYVFASKKNHHFFCKHCGVRVFGVGNDTPMGKMYGVNVGCLEGVTEQQLASIPITYVDGMHDRWDTVPEYHKHL